MVQSGTHHSYSCHASYTSVKKSFPFYPCDFRQQQARCYLKSSSNFHLVSTPAVLLFYLLPKPEPLWVTQSFPPFHTPNIRAKSLSYLTINTDKSLAWPTHPRGSRLEHVLYRPGGVPGFCTGWRSMLHQTSFVITREVHFPNQRACVILLKS